MSLTIENVVEATRNKIKFEGNKDENHVGGVCVCTERI